MVTGQTLIQLFYVIWPSFYKFCNIIEYKVHVQLTFAIMIVTNKFKVDVIWWTFVLPSDIISAPNTSSIRTGKFPGFLCKVLRQQPHRPVNINFVSQHFWRQLCGGQGETGIGNMHSVGKALQTCTVAHCGLPQPEYWNKHCLEAQQSTWLGIFV